MKKQNGSNLPKPEKIRAEVKEAEALGIHREPPDFLSPVVEDMVVSGHDEALWPSEQERLEDLTR